MFGKHFGAARPALTPRQAVEKASKGEVTILDVREHDEVKLTGTAQGGLHIPLSLLPLRADPKAPDYDNRLAGKPIAVFCAIGGRAGRAADFLGSLGHEAHNIGGFSDWQAAGGPVTR